MKVTTLEKLFENELRDLYDAEKRLTRALPKLAKAAESDELRAAIEEHLEVTKGQVTRLEKVFDAIGQKASAKTCPGMKGLIEEGDEQVAELEKGTLRDLAIIGAARRVEHYEMASYLGLISLAEAVADEEVQELLRQTLEEEKEADERMESIGSELVQEAEGSDEEDEEETEAVDMDEDESEEEEQRVTATPKRSPAVQATSRKR